MLRLSLSPAYGTSDTTATAAALARMYGLTPAGNHDHNQTLTRGEDCRTPDGWTPVRQSFLKRIFHIHIFARPIPHFDRRPHAGSACVRRHLFEKTLQPYKGGVLPAREESLGVNKDRSFHDATPPLPKFRHLVHILYNLITTYLNRGYEWPRTSRARIGSYPARSYPFFSTLKLFNHIIKTEGGTIFFIITGQQ